jgi:cystathionine beta-lyase
MSQFDFDTEINREGTDSVKWEFHVHSGKGEYWEDTKAERGDDRVLAMWVADMDFRCPEPVIDALRRRVEHGLFGYSAKGKAYEEAVCGWFARRQNWPVKPEWLSPIPGVVPALNVAVRAFTKPGDKVIVQRPVYYPFFRVSKNNGCEIVSNGLIYEDGVYSIDFDDLERKAADPKAKMLILCSPHNPIGRVWTADELTRIADICARNKVIVIADEIHGDLIMPGETFVPFATLGDGAEQNCVVCTAPSKTFNLAGMHSSNMFIPNAELRERFTTAQAAQALPGMSPFGITATIAAYNEGEPWLEAVMAYITDNAKLVMETFAAQEPRVKPIMPQGTYLQWIDCRGLGLDKNALEDLMLNKAKVYFDEGYIFGAEGEGFERINIACPRPLLKRALDRMITAMKDV